MDEDLDRMTREELIAQVKKLRQGIRMHRDSSGHELCWHHPALWGLLPEKEDPIPVVPDWPQFLRGCIRYRQSLDEQQPEAPRSHEEHRERAEHEKHADRTAQEERLEHEERSEHEEHAGSTGPRLRSIELGAQSTGRPDAARIGREGGPTGEGAQPWTGLFDKLTQPEVWMRALGTVLIGLSVLTALAAVGERFGPVFRERGIPFSGSLDPFAPLLVIGILSLIGGLVLRRRAAATRAGDDRR